MVEEEYGPFEIEEQRGYRAGRSCILLFVDLAKAYYTVPIKKLWEVLTVAAIGAIK